MRPGKKAGMPRAALLLLLAGVMLCCLGIFLSLPQSTASSEMAEVLYTPPAGTDGGSNAPPPEESYPLTATEERQKKAKLPVNASLLTLVVLAIASSLGASQGAISSWGLQGGGDRRWLVAGRDEGPSSFLGVFRL